MIKVELMENVELSLEVVDGVPDAVPLLVTVPLLDPVVLEEEEFVGIIGNG